MTSLSTAEGISIQHSWSLCDLHGQGENGNILHWQDFAIQAEVYMQVITIIKQQQPEEVEWGYLMRLFVSENVNAAEGKAGT